MSALERFHCITKKVVKFVFNVILFLCRYFHCYTFLAFSSTKTSTSSYALKPVGVARTLFSTAPIFRCYSAVASYYLELLIWGTSVITWRHLLTSTPYLLIQGTFHECFHSWSWKCTRYAWNIAACSVGGKLSGFIVLEDEAISMYFKSLRSVNGSESLPQ